MLVPDEPQDAIETLMSITSVIAWMGIGSVAFPLPDCVEDLLEYECLREGKAGFAPQFAWRITQRPSLSATPDRLVHSVPFRTRASR